MEKRGVLGVQRVEEYKNRSQEDTNGRVGETATQTQRETGSEWLKIVRRLRYPPDVIRAKRFTPRATGIMTANPIET
jgi:hypothetical protein